MYYIGGITGILVAALAISIGWSIVRDKPSTLPPAVPGSEDGHVSQTSERSTGSSEDSADNDQAPATRKVLKNIQETGIDAIVTQTATMYTIEFSEPVNFASLIVKNNTGEMVLKALRRSGEVIDMDVGIIELNVFGDGIVELVLVNVSGKVSALTFIPAL